MRLSRARYVTLCQQSLVTAAVLAVGVSAAGVKTLDIVPQPGPAAGARDARSETPLRDALAHMLAGGTTAAPLSGGGSITLADLLAFAGGGMGRA